MLTPYYSYYKNFKDDMRDVADMFYEAGCLRDSIEMSMLKIMIDNNNKMSDIVDNWDSYVILTGGKKVVCVEFNEDEEGELTMKLRIV